MADVSYVCLAPFGSCEDDMKQPAETIMCPDCGLLIATKAVAASPAFAHDEEAWQRQCKRPRLGGPVWCLIARDGTSPKAQTSRTGLPYL